MTPTREGTRNHSRPDSRNALDHGGSQRDTNSRFRHQRAHAGEKGTNKVRESVPSLHRTEPWAFRQRSNRTRRIKRQVAREWQNANSRTWVPLSTLLEGDFSCSLQR